MRKDFKVPISGPALAYMAPRVGLPHLAQVLSVEATTKVSRANFAKHLYDMRRMRDKFLPPDLFAEPGWDILLLLYWAREKQQRMSVSAVCVSAGVPATTALRWIQNLLETDMLDKEPHPTDLRVTWLTLSNRAKAALDDYLAKVIEKGC